MITKPLSRRFLRALLPLLLAAAAFWGLDAAIQAAPSVHRGPVPPIQSGYGSWGEHAVLTESFQISSQGYTNTVVLYYPQGQTAPAPTVFFAPGWDVACRNYAGMLHFLASKGYVAVCDDYEEQSSLIGAQLRESFIAAANRYPARIDPGHIGLAGHSAGAGLLPSTAYALVRGQGWGGAEGEHTFIFSAAPWFDFDLTDAMLSDYPARVKLLMLTGEEDKSTDPRTSIDIFESLPLPDTEKDYLTPRTTLVDTYTYHSDHPLIATGEAGYGVYDALDDYAVFRLLEALAVYTFEGSPEAKAEALGDGIEAQIEMGALRDLLSTDDPRPIPGETYPYPCDVEANPRRAHCADYDHELPAAALITPTKHLRTFEPLPLFRWEPVPTAEEYFLQLRPLLPNGEPDWEVSYGVSLSAAEGGCAAGGAECSFRLSGALPAAPYVWWIKAYSGTREGVWSRRGYFQVETRLYLPLVTRP